MTLDEIKQFFKADRYVVHSGIEIDSAADYEAVCSMQIKDMHLNAGNVVQGGAIFTLADFAFAVAASCMGDLTLSLSNSITFARPPKGSILKAHAVRLSSTNRTCLYEVTVTDELDTFVSKMIVNGYIKKAAILTAD